MWEDILYYDATSPSGLRWKSSNYFGRGRYNIARLKDSVAGSSKSRNRWQLVIDKKNLLAHRIIWEMFHGQIPEGYQIDHINRNSLDNNISNLRLVTQDTNTRNCKIRDDNSSGKCGVFYKESTDKRNAKEYTYSSWVAQWNSLDGKRKSKSFSIKKYGYDEAFRLACEWRQKMILELNAQGAGYTENHGKDSK